MRPGVIRLLVPVALFAATAIAMGREPARKNRQPLDPGPSSTRQAPATPNYIDPGDGGGGGGGAPPPVVMTKVIDTSIPAWGVSESNRYRITWNTDGLQSVETLDAAGNVIDVVTRQDYLAIEQNMPALNFAEPGATAEPIAPAPLTSPMTCHVVVTEDLHSIASVPGPVDSAFTVVVNVHN